MIAARSVLAAIAWVAAFVATIGAVLINPTVMGVAGLVAAVAALGWGLLCALSKPDRQGTPFVIDHPHGRGPVESETIHRPAIGHTIIRGGQHPRHGFSLDHVAFDEPYDEPRPYWDTDIHGAPE